VTIGGLNEVKAFRTDDFSLVATIPVGKLPHGIWPSGDGARVYVGLESGDELVAIDTLTNTVVAKVPIGQGSQAVVYVPNAVAHGAGTEGLRPLGIAGEAAHLTMVAVGGGTMAGAAAPTSVALFDQGLVQVLEASVTGLEPKRPYLLALAEHADGGGRLEPLAGFTTNPAGAQIVNAVGPIRQIVRGGPDAPRRYLVIVAGSAAQAGAPVQVQAE
jgi:YVTN family beta-propeller protein